MIKSILGLNFTESRLKDGDKDKATPKKKKRELIGSINEKITRSKMNSPTTEFQKKDCRIQNDTTEYEILNSPTQIATKLKLKQKH